MGCSSISVRGLAAIVVVCALACLAAASASAAPLAFVANRDSNEVSVLDTGTNHLVGGQIEVGEGPASVAVTPDGSYAYITDAFEKTVSVIDTSTLKIVGKPIEVGTTPFGIAIAPDGSLAFVTDRGSDEVSMIDTATRKVVAEIPVGEGLGSGPTGVAVSPDGKLAYVTIFGEDAVEVIDTSTSEVVGEPIEVGDGPEGVELAPDGATAYVVDSLGHEVSVIDTATGKVTPIPLASTAPRGIVVAPDGKQAFVVSPESDSVSVIDTATDREIDEIPVGSKPQEVAITADGKTVYVTEAGPPLERVPQVQRISVEKGAVVGSPIKIPGEFPAGIAIAPDQSPIAAFAVPDITAGVPVRFSGTASTDSDGRIASYAWTFGDGGTASEASPSHTYVGPGVYNAKLSVVDDLGCGEEEVFTGRTAYCSGGASNVTHPVQVKAPPPTMRTCSANFGIGGVSHNRKNGTVRVRIRFPTTGYFLLFGKKIHAVTRKVRKPGTTVVTLHARVELNKRLKKTLRANVRYRLTFTSNAGCGSKTVHRSVALLRAPRHKHHR